MTGRYKYSYTDVKTIFEKEGCVLLSTEQDYLNKTINTHPKYKYIASCGHEHIVMLTMFLSKKSGIICPRCKYNEYSINMRDAVKDDKLRCLKLELTSIDYIKEIFGNLFNVIKAFDGCKSDIIIKPTNIVSDKWLGIQVKSTLKPTTIYSFLYNKDYPNCIIFFICWEDKKMWAIPNNIITGLKKISIGLINSKYNKYLITPENIISKFTEFYNNTHLDSFEYLDTPTNIYQQREKEYRIYRERILDFIKFDNNEMEGLVYDFKIGNLKIQEKVGGMCNKRINSFIFDICKNGKKKEGDNFIHLQVQYEKGDNDIYWLNCNNKKHFFVLPEHILIKNGYIDNNTKIKKMLKINPISKKKCWIKEFLFDYENVDKPKLMAIINGIISN